MSIDIYQSQLLIEAGFPNHGFTKRTGGASSGPFASLNLGFDVGDEKEAVVENWRRVRDFFRTNAPLARVNQVHSNRVVNAERAIASSADLWTAAAVVEADAIVTEKGGVALAVQSADCAPVLLADPKTRIALAAHAGWRGAARGIIRNSVRVMQERGAAPLDIVAAIGPCVCGKCYEVGEEVARCFPESADPIKGKKEKFLLDLKHAIYVSLLAAGLTGRRIDIINACSACLRDEFFSFRRCGEPTGRFIGYICL